MDITNLTPDQIEILATLAESSNASLINIADTRSTQAFNTGCSAGLVPGLFIILLVVFLSKGSVATIAITIVLVIMILTLFAAVIANISRTKAMERLYGEIIQPDIERTLRQEMIAKNWFNQVATQVLPENAPLLKYLAGE